MQESQVLLPNVEADAANDQWQDEEGEQEMDVDKNLPYWLMSLFRRMGSR